MEEIKMFKAPDGKLFETWQECQKHEAFLDLKAFVEKKIVFDDDGPSSSTVADFIFENWNELRDILGWAE